MSIAMLRVLLTRPIAFSPVLAHIGGSASAGLFMSQAVYWTGRLAPEREGWFWKSREEWHEETCLTRSELDVSRARWRDLGVLEEHKHGVPPTVRYRINLARLYTLVERYIQLAENGKLIGDLESDQAFPIGSNEQIDLSKTANPYTESTPEITTPIALATGGRITEVGAYEPPPKLTLTAPAILEEATAFTFFGKKPITAKGSAAPDSVRVSEGNLTWAQGRGWRGDLQHLQHTADDCLDFFKGKPDGKKMDWSATVRHWVVTNINEGRDIAKTMMRSGQQPTNAQGSYNGQDRGRTAGAAPAYGYNSAGEPTNRATQLQTTAQQLAEQQRTRRQGLSGLSGQDRGDAITLSDDDWRSLNTDTDNGAG